MKYDRQDSMAKAMNCKEPQKLKASLKAPKGYKNTLDEQQDDRIKRRNTLEEAYNRLVGQRDVEID